MIAHVRRLGTAVLIATVGLGTGLQATLPGVGDAADVGDVAPAPSSVRAAANTSPVAITVLPAPSPIRTRLARSPASGPAGAHRPARVGVPAAALAFPGLLVILVAIVQTVGGVAWLPVVRRALRGTGFAREARRYRYIGPADR